MENLNIQGLNPDTEVNPEKKISRKEAIEKAGKYAAFTAAAALVLLSPKTSQATSPDAASESKSTSRGRKYWGIKKVKALKPLQKNINDFKEFDIPVMTTDEYYVVSKYITT